MTESVRLQVLLNIPVGTYQVQFNLEYTKAQGIVGVLFNVTMEQNLCQNICKYVAWKRIHPAYKWLIVYTPIYRHCHTEHL